MKLFLHNTLSRKKEAFTPIVPNHVGMYVCGPTVYGDPHLGHARSALTFDLLFRLLKSLDYKVRYVRNITDVGHLENDADQGEDKIAKYARLQQLEPMEVAQFYTNRYHHYLHLLGALDPSIEPHASGHIIEQIELTKTILNKGYAYESNGSIYFDVEHYAENFNYGELSGRNLEDMQSGGRSDDFQSEKRNATDFALWKKASPEHIMRWPSPWSDGFPGWHCECSAMSKKYLGETFDIHGGGLDLVFPHHECEIAQSNAANGKTSCNYWIHNNMITLNGQKMGKSLGNAISLEQFFTGDHPMLEKAYSPMVVRFFIMQAHYRSTLDFSNEALQATEKGMDRLINAWQTLGKLSASSESTCDNVEKLRTDCMTALCDDMNSPVAIALLFDWTKTINSINDGNLKISQKDLEHLQQTFDLILGDIIGITNQSNDNSPGKALEGAMETLIELRLKARENKDWATSDIIRDKLAHYGIKLKDGKEVTVWEVE